MILVNVSKGEYVDESDIFTKEDSMSIFTVLCKTRWEEDATYAVGLGFTAEVASIRSKYRNIAAEAVEVYNSYTMAKLR